MACPVSQSKLVLGPRLNPVQALGSFSFYHTTLGGLEYKKKKKNPFYYLCCFFPLKAFYKTIFLSQDLRSRRYSTEAGIALYRSSDSSSIWGRKKFIPLVLWSVSKLLFLWIQIAFKQLSLHAEGANFIFQLANYSSLKTPVISKEQTGGLKELILLPKVNL